tara:strand:+ start:1045 stop:1332 length:288 start_codon:yes stop_codon:yes gene_type:complete
MKTKFKDFLLYSMACIGAISLFLSVTNSQSTMDVNIVGLNGKTLNSWCSNDDCSIAEIVPTRDFNGKLNSIYMTLDEIKGDLYEVQKAVRYIKTK